MEKQSYMAERIYVNEHEAAEKEILRCGDMVVGMAYVPMQTWGHIIDPPEALCRGTQFPELDKPFFGEDVWA